MTQGVETIEQLLQQSGLRSPNAQTYVQRGRGLLFQVADAVHERNDPPGLEEETLEFLALTWQYFTPAAIGEAARGAGLGAEDAAAAMNRGEFDPFTEAGV